MENNGATSDHLCVPCRRILQDGRRVGYRADQRYWRKEKFRFPTDEEIDAVSSPHHVNFRAFVSSATTGCHICVLLLAQLTSDDQRRMLPYEHESYAKLYHYWAQEQENQPHYAIWVTYFMPPELLQEKKNHSSVWMKLQLWPTQEHICLIHRDSIERLYRSRWDLIKEWVSTCVDHHKKCASPVSSPEHRPRRLIQVGTKEDFSDVSLRCDVGPNERYMTLSHCWGPDGVPIKLLESNLQQFTAQMPWAELPKTFRDAIEVVRNIGRGLGTHYLWIDALCIVQDSDTDKQQELNRMGHIYKQSLCNLAACLGGDSSCGLLQDVDPLSLKACVVDTGSSGQMEGCVRIENKDLYDTAVKGSMLSSRGWVLQEVTLAPRIVYFTTSQVVWECSETCFYEGSPSHSRINSLYPLKSWPLNRSTTLDTANDPGFDEDYRFWMTKVLQYTQRTLTYNTDKLDAISAIARHTHERLTPRDEYVLGLWKRYLYLHVLWAQQTNFRPYSSHVHRNHGRPTWSWVSVNGEVYNHRTYREAIENTICLVTLTPRVQYANEQNIFGEAVSAELDATGVVAKVILRVYHNKKSSETRDTAIIFLPSQDSEGPRQLTQHFADLDVLIGSREEPHPKMWAYCLFVVRENRPGSSTYSLVGLLLDRSRSRCGVFRRIGRFSVEQPECEGLLEDIKSNYPLAENDYLECTGDGMHKITIV